MRAVTSRQDDVRQPLGGRVAVVTGGSSGIGLGAAKALAAEGASVVLVSRSDAHLRVAAQEVSSMRNTAGCLAVRCDVSDARDVGRMADLVERQVGMPDIVVSNAGVGHWAPVVDLPLERFRAIVDTNLFGAVHCVKAFLPPMLARGRGTLAFVSSGLGAMAFPYTSAYCASKHALNGFAGSLRAEVEPLGVDVLLVMPGGTRTAFFDANEYPADVLSRYLFQRFTDPDRVGRRIVRAILRRRRRIVIGAFNDVGLRLLGALPEIQSVFLGIVGNRIRRRQAANPSSREPR